ncbi:integrase [Virgibacillus natechei]|uniref:Integrase n=1 Tax=Virgibacillus natechei TaxID=1216297 RepID=A0ABS4IHS0_9BACI|nr:site-specific integrase [Virgibacillus natechei]MBP1970504.1 integrase [Virgibacillus natechei]UZD14091.1 site-specific integrase [Virgibacillus natechei]
MRKDRFVVRETNIELRRGEKLENTRKILIGYYKESVDIVYPHPITDFINKEYFNTGKSLSHQKHPAIAVTQFLNFVLDRVADGDGDFAQLEKEGIPGLELKHGSSFLSSLTEEKDISKKTIESKMMYLTRLFHFLNENEILNTKIKFKHKDVNNKPVLISKFKDVVLPGDGSTKKLKKKKDIITSSNKNRVQLTREFIMTAYLNEPSIALGIGFLFYGGLRLGECVNLKRSSVKPQGNSLYGEEGIVLEIRDNQDELFSHLTKSANIDVKKPRDQVVLLDPVITWLYKKHLDYLDKLEKQNKLSNPKALFINENNGLALSGATFSKKFNKVKGRYLENLSRTSGRLQDYLDLKETKWSTHIGRGTFTNMLVAANFTAEQTAITRGDSNINSALDYTDSMTALDNINKAIETLTLDNDSMNNINLPEFSKTWKEVVNFGKIR